MLDDPAPQQKIRMSREERIRRIVGYLLIAVLSLITLYGVYRPLGPPGIDPGWQWAVNQARDAGLIFGRDIVFTYGPLAYLMAPLDVSSNLLLANGFFLTVQVLFAVSLAVLFRRDPRLLPIAAFAVLFVIAHHQGLAVEGFFLLVVGLLSLLSVFTDHRIPLAIAATLAAILLLVKMSLGVASLVILAAALLIARVLFHRSYRLALGLVPFPAVLIVLGFLLFDRPGTFFTWLRLSAQVVSGYSVANSITNAVSNAGLQVAVGVITVGVWIGLPIVLRHDKNLLAYNLLFAPVVLIQFRLAFVRQDFHQIQFIPFMLALIAISVLFTHDRKFIGAHVA
ncbi:hypothetical protein ACFLQM_02535, partial [Acidobacteriota bacterium]